MLGVVDVVSAVPPIDPPPGISVIGAFTDGGSGAVTPAGANITTTAAPSRFQSRYRKAG